MNTQENTQTIATPYIKLKKSEKMEKQYDERLSTPEWRALSVRQAIEAAFIHRMEVQNQINREIYEEKFGVKLDEDEIVSLEEIEATEATIREISKKIEEDMKAKYGMGPKASQENKTNRRNLNFIMSGKKRNK